MLLCWITVLPLVLAHIHPQMEPGKFNPSTNWILQHASQEDPAKGGNHSLGMSSDPRTTEDRHQNFPPCCPCEPLPKVPPAAAITTTSLTLTCETPYPYEFISWWLYQCPQSGHYKKLLQLTEGPTLYLDGFRVRTGRAEKGFYSSLRILDISSNSSSGLYQCVSHATSSSTPFFSRTDYFVIGKRETMRECLYDAFTRNDFKRQIETKLEIENYRQPRISNKNDNGTKSLSNEWGRSTLIFDINDAISEPDFQNIDLEPPTVQQGSEIPIQNSSYARFDFTGGDKLQNRNVPV